MTTSIAAGRHCLAIYRDGEIRNAVRQARQMKECDVKETDETEAEDSDDST